jgi:hypothetical protein
VDSKQGEDFELGEQDSKLELGKLQEDLKLGEQYSELEVLQVSFEYLGPLKLRKTPVQLLE